MARRVVGHRRPRRWVIETQFLGATFANDGRCSVLRSCGERADDAISSAVLQANIGIAVPRGWGTVELSGVWWSTFLPHPPGRARPTCSYVFGVRVNARVLLVLVRLGACQRKKHCMAGASMQSPRDVALERWPS